jgi:hypothetical protein
VVTGTVEGAGPDDVGRTIDVRLAGDRAYTRSLRVPIILLVLALGFLAAGIYVMRALLRQSARRPAPPPPAG